MHINNLKDFQKKIPTRAGLGGWAPHEGQTGRLARRPTVYCRAELIIMTKQTNCLLNKTSSIFIPQSYKLKYFGHTSRRTCLQKKTFLCWDPRWEKEYKDVDPWKHGRSGWGQEWTRGEWASDARNIHTVQCPVMCESLMSTSNKHYDNVTFTRLTHDVMHVHTAEHRPTQRLQSGGAWGEVWRGRYEQRRQKFSFGGCRPGGLGTEVRQWRPETKPL